MADRLRHLTRGILVAAIVFALPPAPTPAQAPLTPDVMSPLDRAARYVADYYSRARSVIAEEYVTIQTLGHDWRPEGLARRLIYELRFEWVPASDTEAARAEVVRELVRINGRAPTADKQPKCMDPRLVSPEPLGFLLPDQRDGLSFREAGIGSIDGRRMLLIDYRETGQERATVTGDKDCFSVEMPGRSRGRVWVDAETSAVLRLEQGLIGPTDAAVPHQLQKEARMGVSVTVNRVDTTINYRLVTFTDPQETVVMPVRVERLNEVRNDGIQRARITHEFRNYRRFLTESRIVTGELTK